MSIGCAGSVSPVDGVDGVGGDRGVDDTGVVAGVLGVGSVEEHLGVLVGAVCTMRADELSRYMVCAQWFGILLVVCGAAVEIDLDLEVFGVNVVVVVVVVGVCVVASNAVADA